MDASGEVAGWASRQVIRTCKASKKSKSGRISLLECYLRDDIPCGSPLCGHGCRGTPALSAHASHYLIPDALALRHFWEIMELPQLTGVIFLSSVLKEVQTYLSGRRWKRLRLLFTDKRRGNLFFDDEHFLYTNATVENGSKSEKLKDYAQWLDAHLEYSLPIIIITGQVEESLESDLHLLADQFQKTCKLTGEIDNKLKVFNIQEYVQCFWSQDKPISDLFTSLVQAQLDSMEDHDARKDAHGIHDKGDTFYKNHMSAIAIEEGLQDGSLLTGVFHATKEKGAFVRPSNKGESTKLEVWIPPGELQNRALHGDIVAVRVLAQAEQVTQDANDKEVSESDMEGDEQTTASQQKATFSGEVVGILQRLPKDYAACLHDMEETAVSSESKRQEHLLCVPMDRRLPMVRITTRQRLRLVGQRFVVRIDNWDADSKLPRGHVVQILGSIGDLETENKAILVENEINVLPFCEMALQELPMDTAENPWRIPASEFAYRCDLRMTHKTYSIDPLGSKDVDDCLSVRHLEDKKLEIGVHIADVSHFVHDGSLLDLEAFSRGTTVYLVGNTYHMLPSILSENLCSLRQGKDRLAVSVVWTVDPENEFEILKVWFGRTIICSRQQMFYAQAQAILDKNDLPEGWGISGGVDEIVQVQSDLSLLAAFAQISKSLREAKGALELVSAEMQFEMGENQEPISLKSKTQLPMNWIVAELMIQANSYVARHIYELLGANTLLRRHPPPKQDNFDYLLKCCEARGVHLNTASNKALASSLDCIQNNMDLTVKMAVKALATRAMSEAEYISAGDAFEPWDLSHYGLALEFYTHFTSPIRRYADIVVHRMLTSLCEGYVKEGRSASRATALDLSQVASQLNERHRASKKAQKQCNELHLLMYLQKHSQAEHAVVIEFQQHSLLVYVPKYDMRGQVHLQDKAGVVILPAKDDDSDDGVVASQAYGQKHMIQCLEDKICIIEVSSGDVIHEYRRMSSVWVQMKADGSRAHSPTLRLRLLSHEHPCVRESMQRDSNPSLEHPQRIKLKALLTESNPKNDGISKASENEKLMAGGKSSSQQKIEIVSQATLKSDSVDNKSSIHELLMDFHGNSVLDSSIYVDDEKFYASPSDGLATPKDISAATLFRERALSSSIDISSARISVSNENPQTGEARKAWQKKLVKAAIQRRKLLRLREPNDSPLACAIHLKEREARAEASLLYKDMMV